MAQGKYLFTSESVSMGHPDKLADQISDGVLDAYLALDPRSRVACETMVTTGLAVIAGEITSTGTIDYQKVVRDVIREVGYTDDEMGIAADTCSVLVAIGKQSVDIAMGVNEDESKGKDIGAGDQGLMFGYACNETPELMPLPIALSHRILNRLTEARQKGEVDWLRPDSKSQVTVEYEGNSPVRIDTIVVSTQHAPHVSNEEIRTFVVEKIVKPLLPKNLDTGSITVALRVGRSSSTPTVAGAATAAVRSPARIRRRSIGAPPTWRGTSPRTSWRPALPTAARCSLPTRSASANR